VTETAHDAPRQLERGRRRSQRSHDAIIRATQELLVEDGYQALTIEGVAARAGVGKQTIYRWWPSRAALVLEAYLAGSDAIPPPAVSTDTRRSVRAMLDWLVAVLAQPIGGGVVAGLVADLKHDADLAERYHRDVVPARRRAMREVLERSQERGDIRADADLDLAIDALHGAVFYRLLLSGYPLDHAFTAALADQVLGGLEAAR